ncbi:MAG: tetratricopeptide repeat protein [Planctomycetes bacterium]|nr:tetratricopeptide repeat protein [Planctomycetota bacterium]
MTAYYVDQILKKKITFFKDVFVYNIGHYLHVIIIQFFFDKDNKYHNRFMCLWCSVSTFIVYWIVYNLFGLTAAIIAGVLYALYIVNPRINGNWGPFEAILALPLLASLFLIIQASKTDSYLLIALSGIFLGYAILIKQTSILYLPGYLLMMLGKNITIASFLIFGGSFLLSNLVPLFYYWKKNTFWEYLACNWLVMVPSAVNHKKYNKFYPKIFVRGEKDVKTRKCILLNNSLSLFSVMFLAAVSLISLAISLNFSIFFIGLTMCLSASVCMIFMRGTLSPHYWLNMVPWLVVIASYSLSKVVSSLFSSVGLDTLQLCGVLAVIGLFLYAFLVDYKLYIIHKDPYGFLRKFYGEKFTQFNYITPKKIAEHIKHTTNPDDKILVCGWTPYIALYSDRCSFTPDICMYAEDYLEIYNKSNPTLLEFINSIYKFKKLRIIKQKKNIFKSGFPEIIVFSDGKGNIKDFEKLTGIYYTEDERMVGYPLYRADKELTELMSFFEYTKNKSIQKTKESELPENLDPQDWDSALEISKQLLKEDPYKTEHLLTLGECLIGSGKYKLLFRFYNRLIEYKMVSTTSSLELLTKLGEAYCHQDKFTEAEETFISILKLKPDNPTVLNNLGFTHSRLNNIDKASSCFQKALELDPNNEDAIANLEQIKYIC